MWLLPESGHVIRRHFPATARAWAHDLHASSTPTQSRRIAQHFRFRLRSQHPNRAPVRGAFFRGQVAMWLLETDGNVFEGTSQFTPLIVQDADAIDAQGDGFGSGQANDISSAELTRNVWAMTMRSYLTNLADGLQPDNWPSPIRRYRANI